MSAWKRPLRSLFRSTKWRFVLVICFGIANIASNQEKGDFIDTWEEAIAGVRGAMGWHHEIVSGVGVVESVRLVRTEAFVGNPYCTLIQVGVKDPVAGCSVGESVTLISLSSHVLEDSLVYYQEIGGALPVVREKDQILFVANKHVKNSRFLNDRNLREGYVMGICFFVSQASDGEDRGDLLTQSRFDPSPWKLADTSGKFVRPMSAVEFVPRRMISIELPVRQALIDLRRLIEGGK